ncbi:MAG: hypothetical protein FWB72_05955, partial [Firmicutes bacterium]|nr:hypothetical protein [Bacillota bacterium]
MEKIIYSRKFISRVVLLMLVVVFATGVFAVQRDVARADVYVVDCTSDCCVTTHVDSHTQSIQPHSSR